MKQDYYQLIYETQGGYVIELQQTIGEDNFRKLETMGYIKRLINSNGETWVATNKFNERYKLLNRKPTFTERLKDWFLLHILKVNFSKNNF